VRVRAGSIKVPPANADVIQVKLNKDAVVQIIGQRDAYYKIVCPPESYFWIALDFVEKVKPITGDDVDIYVSEAKQSIVEGGIPEEVSVPQNQMELDRQLYRDAAKMLRAELDKPILERNYDEITAKLDKLVEKTKYPSIQATAKMLKRRVEIALVAQEIQRKSLEQDEDLEVALSSIQDSMQKMVAENQPKMKKADDMVVKGRLAESAIFTTPHKGQRFLVLGESDRILCYAVSNVEGLDLAAWIGKTVSLVGPAEFDTFSKIRVLRVNSLIDLPAE
jgi:hypothetical protein